ncbi:unnamed protein product [Clonostachys solani]|uniref:Vacuolar protein sorting-associated protein TDA6 n=1 Tax=Clonostachys solani TaxID=160281 RepID=A0A9N9WB67_9HYPO|nr:unnamed protein product [Clonostachys solani]
MSARLISASWLLVLASLLNFACCSASYDCPDYVAKHAPIVWLHSDDAYLPSDLLTHVQHTTPKIDGKLIKDKLPALNLDNLDLLNNYRDVALASNDDPLSNPAWMRGTAPDKDGRIHDATPCVVILVDNPFNDVDAFYFYFYSFDQGPNITQVMHPLERVVKGGKVGHGMHFGNHVGDWEHNMIRFKDGKPVGIWYSQHRDGAAYQWGDPELSVTDGRPTVYSAHGSHANYAKPGDNIHDVALIDWCNKGKKWDPVLSAYFFKYHKNNETLTTLNSPDKKNSGPPAHNFTSLFYYNGIWGDDQLLDSDPRQDHVPKFGFPRFLDGPQGPKYKQIVRKEIYPNRRPKKTWIEFSAGMFMTVYPWALQGWRGWVTFVFVVILIFLLGVGAKVAITKGVRRYYSRGRYQKLQQGEQILMEDFETNEVLFSSRDRSMDRDRPDRPNRDRGDDFV